MLIRSVQLENYKSYQFGRVDLQEGTTAIIGSNGAGKSSILEAIGLCLFNHASGKLSSLLREGAKEAIIEVRLVSSLDGCEYLIERRFDEKTTRQYRVYGPGATEQVLAEGVAEVQGWLMQHMRIPPDSELGTLFSNTVGVAQGTFTAPFLLSATQRQAIFDPLLRVQEYKKASDNLRPTVRELKDQESALAQEIAGMQGQLVVLPGLRDEQETLAKATLNLGVYITGLSKQVLDLESELEALDGAEKRVEETHHQAARAQDRLDAHNALRESAVRAFEEAEKAAHIAQANRPGYEAYLEAERELGELEASRTERDRLMQQQGYFQTEVALLEAAREQEEIADEALETAKLNVQETEDGLRRAKEVEARNKGLDADLEKVRAGVGEIRASQATTKAEIARLKKQSEILVASQTGRCPLCEAELTEEHRGAILARNDTLIENHQTLAADLNERERVCAANIGDLQRETSECRTELRELPSPADLQKAQRDCAQAAKALEQAGNRVASFAHAPQALERLEEELTPFAALDEELARWQEQREGHQTAYSLYLTSAQLAKQQPERRAKVDELLGRHRELESERTQRMNEHLQAKIAYDATEHATVKSRVSEAQNKLAASKAQYAEKEYRLEVVKTCIGELESLENEVAAMTATATETAALLAMTETMREILREAGPHITRRLVRQISQRASTIFGDLVGDPARRLDWSDDYELSLGVRGHRRSFAQLSGGEQMSAALALRLSLLHETSSIDVAFFDEPTTHLDPERRQSLAERIMQVKGLGQLLVISHDDSFEATAANVIHVVKGETGSHVADGGSEPI